MTDIKKILLEAAQWINELHLGTPSPLADKLEAAAASMGEPAMKYRNSPSEMHVEWEALPYGEHMLYLAPPPPADPQHGKLVGYIRARDLDSRTFIRQLNHRSALEAEQKEEYVPVFAGAPPPAVTDAMVNKLLSWPLPESLISDHCATQPGTGRSGTNLMTYGEAKQMLEHVLTAPEQPKAGAVAEGWQLVPVEPTDEMIDAGVKQHTCVQEDRWYSDRELDECDCIAVYKSMLAAGNKKGVTVTEICDAVGISSDRTAAPEQPKAGAVPDSIVRDLVSWLDSTLHCKSYKWDPEQRESAETTVSQAKALLAAAGGRS